MGDVCNWEIIMTNKTIQKYFTNITLSQISFNLSVNSLRNVTIFVMQGNNQSIKQAKLVSNNLTENKTYQFPLSNGTTLFVIAYPTNQNTYTNNSLELNFTLSSPFFPVDGGNWLLL
jgi:hypothetical protein